MRAIDVTDPSGQAILLEVDAPEPRAAHGEVVLQVAAAGVNNADLLQRAGRYPPPPGAPHRLGLEATGRVLAVGAGVDPGLLGAPVAALLDGAGYAERVAVPAAQLLPAPAGVDLVDAAALPEAACTAWSTLVMAAGLGRGEWLLVHGGSGGVGTVAVQIAVALGARVIATAGGPDRARRCAALGAEVVVDHLGQDFVAEVARATGGAGADVVLDVVGGAYLGRNVEALATGGRLAVIGLAQGRRGELDLGALLAKRATVLGTTLRSRPPHEKAAIVAAVREHVWPMVADGRVRPVVHERIPLAQADRAHQLLASGVVFGSLVLVP